MNIIEKIILVVMVIGAIAFYAGIVILSLGMFLGLRFTKGLDRKKDSP